MEAFALNAFDPEQIPHDVAVDLCVLAIQMIMEQKKPPCGNMTARSYDERM